ncbi:uncharacterized protein [Musca autumnalis]|uniref:uncharacterized protein n=1 Tax=Musca autumnalis TaxID=221902 RepID=UPI003CEF94A4
MHIKWIFFFACLILLLNYGCAWRSKSSTRRSGGGSRSKATYHVKPSKVTPSRSAAYTPKRTQIVSHAYKPQVPSAPMQTHVQSSLYRPKAPSAPAPPQPIGMKNSYGSHASKPPVKPQYASRPGQGIAKPLVSNSKVTPVMIPPMHHHITRHNASRPNQAIPYGNARRNNTQTNFSKSHSPPNHVRLNNTKTWAQPTFNKTAINRNYQKFNSSAKAAPNYNRNVTYNGARANGAAASYYPAQGGQTAITKKVHIGTHNSAPPAPNGPITIHVNVPGGGNVATQQPKEKSSSWNIFKKVIKDKFASKKSKDKPVTRKTISHSSAKNPNNYYADTFADYTWENNNENIRIEPNKKSVLKSISTTTLVCIIAGVVVLVAIAFATFVFCRNRRSENLQ